VKFNLEYLEGAVNKHLQCNYALIALCQIVLRNVHFAEAPGGVEHHHNYPKGLVEHVGEVMNNAVKLAGGNPSPVLIVSVIWHDFMKIRDYSINYNVVGHFCFPKPNVPEFTLIKEPYRKLINHVSGSFGEFYYEAKTMGLPQEFIDDVSHCLLSHHGRKEWGSPVEHLTADAFILHTADNMSAHGIIL